MNQQNLLSPSLFNIPHKKELRTSLNKLLTSFALILILISSLTCKKSPNEPNNQDFFSFTFEDVSCTEAWFNIKIFNLEKPVIASVYVNDALNSTFNIISSDDTTFYVENLLPKKNYEVYVELISANKKVYRSNRLSFTTMDTTSHNFTFQSWEFGEGASSALYDVAIIDENNIWAVGEIYMKDSLGNYDPHAYNAVHWDGTKWEVKRIYTFSNCSSVDYAPLRSIYAFSQDKIVVTSGGGMWWFNGNRWYPECSINPILTGAINKLWGSSSEDLYAVGYNGMIAHWDGKRWTKIESGTDLHIYDIWGDYDKKTNEWEILVVAAQLFIGPNRKILKISKNLTEELSTTNIPDGSIHSVWFNTNRRYYVVGNGIYKKKNLNDNIWNSSLRGLTPFYTYSIRGSKFNNIFICGSFGELLHFNGFTWKSFRSTPGFFDSEFYSVDVKDKLVVAVGQRFNTAYITIGKSNF